MRHKAELDEWQNTPHSARIQTKVVEAIARRRRQLLVHSYIYYGLNSNIIPDSRYDKWGFQLEQLQKKFGYKIGFFDKAFQNWIGGSGFQLPRTFGVANVGLRLLRRWEKELECTR